LYQLIQAVDYIPAMIVRQANWIILDTTFILIYSVSKSIGFNLIDMRL